LILLQCLFSFNFGEQDMAHITNKDLNAEPHQPGAGHLNILMKMRYMYWIFFGKSGTMNYYLYDRASSVVILSTLMYALEV